MPAATSTRTLTLRVALSPIVPKSRDPESTSMPSVDSTVAVTSTARSTLSS